MRWCPNFVHHATDVQFAWYAARRQAITDCSTKPASSLMSLRDRLKKPREDIPVPPSIPHQQTRKNLQAMPRG